MRSNFAGIVLLSASMAVVYPAHAEKQPQGPPGFGNLQTPTDHQQSTNDNLKAIEKDNELNELPASHDETIGAGQVHSEEDALTKKIDQDNARLDRLVNGICPRC